MRSRKVRQAKTNFRSVRIVLLGQEGVGKSALTVRFISRRFIGEYDRTSESSYRHFIEMDNKPFCLDILDTAGEVTDAKLQLCRTQGDIFLILYSITDYASFEEAIRIGRAINDHKKNAKAPLVMTLVGNKKDLDHFRVVDESLARDFSAETSCLFQEISVSERNGYEEVRDVMHNAIRHYLEHAQLKRVLRRENTSVSYLSKMKEGIMRRTGSMRRKSVAF